ncbi:hypothetical protein [Thalassomonas sp. RHCl1]|uniref:hypothetical protein n=1 Tax=Thalassomonas sp. RHCl1 TaxID=2995320 RepID=UPI00248BAD40|nr:hypothetical protein [Thalassomonas sp. RHCl1]
MNHFTCVVKKGNGVEAKDGDTLSIHYRYANNPEKLLSDTESIHSTYLFGKAISVSLSNEYLRKSVYEALVHQTVGSTIQIRDTERNCYLEIWIEDIVDKSSERQIISYRRVMPNYDVTSEIKEKIARALRSAHKQKQGVCLNIAKALKSEVAEWFYKQDISFKELEGADDSMFTLLLDQDSHNRLSSIVIK